MLGLPCSTKNSAIDALIAQGNSVTSRLAKMMVNTKQPTREAHSEESKEERGLNPICKLSKQALNLIVALETEDVYPKLNSTLKCELCDVGPIKNGHLKTCAAFRTKTTDDKMIDTIDKAKSKKFPLKEMKQEIYDLGRALDNLCEIENQLIQEKIWTKTEKWTKATKKQHDDQQKKVKKLEQTETARC
jgi:hypothetical protein